MVSRVLTPRRNIACFAVQESSTKTGMCDAAAFHYLKKRKRKNGTSKTEKFYVTVAADTKEAKTAEKAAPAKPKAPAKAPAKPLPQMMEEDVIPSLKSILESQEDISDIELSFQDNTVSSKFLILYLFVEDS